MVLRNAAANAKKSPQRGVTGFDPATGLATGEYRGDAQAEAACTAVAYAIARGDTRRVADFSRVDISGLVAP